MMPFGCHLTGKKSLTLHRVGLFALVANFPEGGGIDSQAM
jgi:hypothetical protein